MLLMFLTAVGAGVLSFLSPCILPLVPAYFTVLTQDTGARTNRLRTVRRTLLFCLGFGIVFVGMGLAASTLGQILRAYRPFLQRAGGVLLILLGLIQIGLLRLLPLARERRLRMPAGGSGWAAFLIGLVFAFGWTPCLGPVLAGILTMAMSGQNLSGGILLAAYALGLALPFLIAAFCFDILTGFLKKLNRFSRHFELAGGCMLLILGVLLLTGRLSWLIP